MRITHLLGTAIAAVLVPCGGAIADTGLVFKDSFGTLYIYGMQPRASALMNLDLGKHPVARYRTANSCGLIKISSLSVGSDLQLTTTKGTLAHFTLSSIPTVNNPPQCRQGHLYTADGWTWPTAAAVAGTSTSSTTTAGGGSTGGGSTGGSTSGSSSTGTSTAGYTPVSLTGVAKVGTAAVVAGLTPGATYKLQLLAGSVPVFNGSLPTADACGLSQISTATLGSGSANYKILASSNKTIYQGNTATIPSQPASWHSLTCLNGQVMMR